MQLLLLSGFRIDPVERLEEVSKEVQSLHQLFSVSPIFGVDFSVEAEAPTIQQLLQPRVEEDTEIIDEAEDTHAIAAYYAEGTAGEEDAHSRDCVVFNSSIGLAVEGMQEGMTLEALWRVL